MSNLLLKNWVINIISIALLIIFWQLLYIIADETLVFPSILSIVTVFFKIIQTSLFWQTYYQTIITLIEAWLITIFSVSLSVSICLLSPFIRKIFEKYCYFFMPLPSFAIIPIFSLFFGLSKTTMLLVMVLSVYWFLSYQALIAIDAVKIKWNKHIKNLNWNFTKTFIHVYIPASAPILFGLNNVSWTYIWRTLITLEIAYGAIGGYFGLGSYLIDVKNKLDIDIMYVILISIALTGVIINNGFDKLSKKFNW